MKSRIKSIKAREILDSRGNPTVEVQLETKDEVFLASVPSGVSVGKYEAVELRDGGKRYKGKGILKAVKNVNEIIAPKLKGENPIKQEKIDKLMIELDGTAHKSKLGANAILAVSIAVCRAGAAAKELALFKYISQLAETKPSLPTPSILLIEGGLHCGNDLDFQEFMIVPLAASSFKEKLQQAAETYQTLEDILKKEYGEAATNVGHEGGFAAPLSKTEEALALIREAIKKAGYENKIRIALDVAASFFYSQGVYKLEGTTFTKQGFLSFYYDLLKNYPIISLEDPYAEEDWEGFQAIMRQLGGKITIIGDDLLATNINRIKEAQEKKACNGLLLKPNQIGTVTETLEAAKLAASYKWKVIVSHRAGETHDDFISDLAAGLGAGFIKAGAPSRGERVAKYNRLLKIEEEIHPVK